MKLYARVCLWSWRCSYTSTLLYAVWEAASVHPRLFYP